MQEELSKLKPQIEALEEYRRQKEGQQISFPLDGESKTVLRKDLLVPTGNEIRPQGLLSAPFYSIEVNLNGTLYWIRASGKN